MYIHVYVYAYNILYNILYIYVCKPLCLFVMSSNTTPMSYMHAKCEGLQIEAIILRKKMCSATRSNVQ